LTININLLIVIYISLYFDVKYNKYPVFECPADIDKLTNAAELSYILNKYVTYLFGSVFMGGMRDGRLLVKTVGASSPFLPEAMLGAMTPTLDSPVALALFINIIVTEKESVPKIITNNTINLFFKTAISILLISNHNSFRVLFDIIASVYFI